MTSLRQSLASKQASKHNVNLPFEANITKVQRTAA